MPRDRIKVRVPVIDLDSIRFTRNERCSIERLYARSDLKSRRLAVDYLGTGVVVPQNRPFIFSLCDRMIPDRSLYVRWQSLLILAHYVETHPNKLWPLILKWGSDHRDDIRTGVGCCVLEHHFDPYFDRALACIERGNTRFASTLAVCLKFGQANLPRNSKRLDEFHRKYQGFSKSASAVSRFSDTATDASESKLLD